MIYRKKETYTFSKLVRAHITPTSNFNMTHVLLHAKKYKIIIYQNDIIYIYIVIMQFFALLFNTLLFVISFIQTHIHIYEYTVLYTKPSHTFLMFHILNDNTVKIGQAQAIPIWSPIIHK